MHTFSSDLRDTFVCGCFGSFKSRFFRHVQQHQHQRDKKHKENEPLLCVFLQASQEETETQARSMELIIHYPTERAVVPTRKHLFCEACIEHHSRGRSASATDRSSFPAPIGQTASHAGRQTQCFNQAARGVTPWKHCTPNDRGRQSGCGLGPRGPRCSHRSMPSKPFVSRMYPKVWEEGQRGVHWGNGRH